MRRSSRSSGSFAHVVLPTVALAALLGATFGRAQPAPVLLDPAANAVLDNGRTDGDDDLEWRFRWSPVQDASAYQLNVAPPDGVRVAIDVVATAPHHLELRPGAYVVDGDRNGWSWSVRARFGTEWGPWSPARAFVVEPVDADPPFRDRAPAACPVLRAPAPGALLRDASVGEAACWRFEWTGCLGADAYTIVVRCAGASAPSIVAEVAATAFTLVRIGPAPNVGTCTWRVRARIDGVWEAWSAVRAFDVAPSAPSPEPGGPRACVLRE